MLHVSPLPCLCLLPLTCTLLHNSATAVLSLPCLALTLVRNTES
jgi:hypothetical protein